MTRRGVPILWFRGAPSGFISCAMPRHKGGVAGQHLCGRGGLRSGPCGQRRSADEQGGAEAAGDLVNVGFRCHGISLTAMLRTGP